MKIIIISLLLFFTVNAQNIWYVDRDATGANTGRSWTDAWTSVDSGGWTGVSTGINWHIIEAGDSIYISGGSDSTVYLPPTNYGSGVFRDYTTPSDIITFSDEVIIAPAWHTGHNGDIYFSSRSNSNNVLFRVQFISNIKFDGGVDKRFHIIDERDGSAVLVGLGGLLQIGNGDIGDLDSLITLKNWHIVSSGHTDIIGLMGSKNKIIDCIIDQTENHYAASNDPIGINVGRGGHTITGNTIISRNNYETTGGTANASVTVGSNFLTDTRLSMTANYYSDSYATIGYTQNDTSYNMIVDSNTTTTFYGDWDILVAGSRVDVATYPTEQGLSWGADDPHKDIIQVSNVGFGVGLGGSYATERLTMTIANNFIIDTKIDGTGWNGVIYSSGAYCNHIFMIYNNLIVSRKTKTPLTAFYLGRPGAAPFWYFDQSVHLLNNTVIGKGTANGIEAVSGWNLDTLEVKNNLFVCDSTAIRFYNLDGADGFDSSYKIIDYNHYAEGGGISGTFAADNALNWTYAQWLAENWAHGGYRDANSDSSLSANVTFTNKYDTLKASYYTTTGRDLGVDLSATYPFLATDILGNTRSGTWDIGALEYQASGVIRKKARVMIVQ